MKRVIREGVFETNSSSSHSVSIQRFFDKKNIPTYAVSKPYDKMMFVWGLKTVDDWVLLLPYYHIIEFEDNDTSEEEKKSIQEEIETIKKNAEIYKNIMIEECLKFQEFNETKARKIMQESYESRASCPTCERYFLEGVLNDCDCNYDIDKIASYFKMSPFCETPEEIRTLMNKIFSNNEICFIPSCK